MATLKKLLSLLVSTAIVLSVSAFTVLANETDTDNDGLTDAQEVNVYNSDPTDEDTDDDGFTDGDEVTLYGTDPANADTDNDGVTDFAEITTYKSNPTQADTDGDGLTDGFEVTTLKTDPNKVDTDNDGLSDYAEYKETSSDPLSKNSPFLGGVKCSTPDITGIHVGSTKVYPFGKDGFKVNAAKNETITFEFKKCNFTGITYDLLFDGNAFADDEYVVLAEATSSNTVTYSTQELLEIFYEELGSTTGTVSFQTSVSTGLESKVITLPVDFTGYVPGVDPVGDDADFDGLSDTDELAMGTDPNNADTDNDGLSDFAEIKSHKTDPLNADTDEDGVSDGDEVTGALNVDFFNKASDPLSIDTDSDGYSDKFELDRNSDPSSSHSKPVNNKNVIAKKDVKVKVKTTSKKLSPTDNIAGKKYEPLVKYNATGNEEADFDYLDEDQWGPSFLDTADHWAADAIENLRRLGVAEGRAFRMYQPYAHITRGELVNMAMKSFNHNLAAYEGVHSFRDVSVGRKYSAAVAAAKSVGIVSGHKDGTFRPDEYVNRAEAVKVLLLSSGVVVNGNERTGQFVDVPYNAWFMPFIAKSAQNNVVHGYDDGTRRFGPADNMTRGQAASVLYQLIREFYFYL